MAGMRAWAASPGSGPVAQRALGQQQGLAEHALGERGQLGGQAEPGALQQRTDGGPTQRDQGQGGGGDRGVARAASPVRRVPGPRCELGGPGG